ncbi:MAG: helix-turn-helix transcriptional regulator [Patescibacteria group bacterium]|mgnify:CR=1 FL=1
MKTRQIYTLDDHIKESLKNPEFKKTWEESEPEYQLARQLIGKRLEAKMSQRDLAKKVKTTQAIISRIETMQANPSLALIKRIAQTLDLKLDLRLS